jgi:hypothetical protein
MKKPGRTAGFFCHPGIYSLASSSGAGLWRSLAGCIRAAPFCQLIRRLALALAANPCDDNVTPWRPCGVATAAEAGRRLNSNEEEVRHYG